MPGDGFVTFDIPDVGRIGLAICYDGFFPEVIRQLAWLGAEVVIQPTLTTTSDREAELVAARANAIFNQLYVVNVNASQPAALGRSVDRRPEGIVRAQAGEGEELITDVLDLEAVERVRGSESRASRGCGSSSTRWTATAPSCRCTAAGSGRGPAPGRSAPSPRRPSRTSARPSGSSAIGKWPAGISTGSTPSSSRAMNLSHSGSKSSSSAA